MCEGERKREATLNPMGRQWVMNYSLSKSQHWCYHRGCQCTGMTAVTAPPQKRFSTDKWYFLIIHLPDPLPCPSAPQPLCAHKMLFFLFYFYPSTCICLSGQDGVRGLYLSHSCSTRTLCVVDHLGWRHEHKHILQRGVASCTQIHTSCTRRTLLVTVLH